ncbi:hypothetical protein [Fundidesulfovibrio agrisoli]|uniref:hypothetical protein n=1 Tax=Fundidesulfovibrio agrisoli TaxID=2922717 RepID=UPI001FAB80EC|nr:hypothetical protein [Fundidesulfovibrio agrisoli]
MTTLQKHSSFIPYDLQFHPHSTTLKDIPVGEKVFFSIRNIHSRFCSGFYSRKRQGKPQGKTPWSEAEKIVYTRYQTPDEMLYGLTHGTPEDFHIAKIGLTEINHIKRKLSYWLIDCPYLLKRYNDIVYILEQETLNSDFKVLLSTISSGVQIELPSGEEAIHRNLERDYALSPSGIEYLSTFYNYDLSLLQLCRNIKSSKTAP